MWIRKLMRSLAAEGRSSHLMAGMEHTADYLIMVGRGRLIADCGMAEFIDRSSEALFITPGVVGKHVASIFAKLGLPPSDSDNRRVIAAIRYLEGH